MKQRYKWMRKVFVIMFLMFSLAPGPGWGAAPHVSPDAVSLGEIGAGKLKKAIVTLNNVDAERKQWSADVDEGWLCKSGQILTGTIEHGRPVVIKISMKSSLNPSGEDNNHHGLYNVVLNVETDNRHVAYHKKLAAGSHREAIVFNVGWERKALEISFHVLDYPPEPVLTVLPRRLDFGTMGQGQKAIKKIEITNMGRQALKWRVYQKPRVQQSADGNSLSGRYFSFLQPEAMGTGQYRTVGPGKDHVEFTGHWSEVEGYPEAQPNSALKYRFSGSGLILYYWKSPAARKISVYLDNRLIAGIDAYSEQTVAAEYRMNEQVGGGSHTLTMVNSLGRVVVEGIKIVGKEMLRGNGNWIKIYPEIGVTTREIDYLHVSVDTSRLVPGSYGHILSLESNGGEAAIEIHADVSNEAGLKILDVYRYVFGNDVLLSSNPEAEARAAYFRNYRKEGIAFRLFSPGSPGTIEFYRWYNPRKQLHYYSYETNGGGRLSREYVFEGTIGNIATSRLPNTRELYRWQHPSTGQHFFSTDPRGEGINKKGYKYDGIAGYVR